MNQVPSLTHCPVSHSLAREAAISRKYDVASARTASVPVPCSRATSASARLKASSASSSSASRGSPRARAATPRLPVMDGTYSAAALRDTVQDCRWLAVGWSHAVDQRTRGVERG